MEALLLFFASCGAQLRAVIKRLEKISFALSVARKHGALQLAHPSPVLCTLAQLFVLERVGNSRGADRSRPVPSGARARRAEIALRASTL